MRGIMLDDKNWWLFSVVALATQIQRTHNISDLTALSLKALHLDCSSLR